MHGFASSELITLYQQYVNKNSFLKENHRRLLEEWGSGDEEELVMSAEYYLLYLHGWPKNKIIARAKNNYDGCCLLALVLFDLATQEVKIIKDYNKWCINKFTLGLVPVIDDDYIKTKYALKINPDYFGKWYSSELNESLFSLLFIILSQFAFPLAIMRKLMNGIIFFLMMINYA